MSLQKKMKRSKDSSNTKVKTGNLLTNVSYRRFKQSDFKKSGFITDILSFLLQNFNPINLYWKLWIEYRKRTWYGKIFMGRMYSTRIRQLYL